jgi:hypothetical protein
MAANGETRVNRNPVFWAVVGLCAVIVAAVLAFASQGVVSTEPAGKSNRDGSSQQTAPQSTDTGRSSGAAGSQPAVPAQPVEGPATTTSGRPGSSDSSR